jgi:hypothetical protein
MSALSARAGAVTASSTPVHIAPPCFNRVRVFRRNRIVNSAAADCYRENSARVCIKP